MKPGSKMSCNIEQIAELIQLNNLPKYHLEAIRKVLSYTNLKNKRVLEIGGSNYPRELIIDLFQCNQWVSVDLIPEDHYCRKNQADHYRRVPIYDLKEIGNIHNNRYVIFNGHAEHIPSSLYNSFDVVYSVACFEHVLRLGSVLSKIYNCLKASGLLFAKFGPLWSCNMGHHINYSEFTDNIPAFGHLIMRPYEMLSHLLNFHDLETADEVVYAMYFNERINRFFYEDYEMMLSLSDFFEYTIEPAHVQDVDPAIQEKLMALYPGRKNFGAYSMCISARK